MTDLTEQWKKGELPSGWYYVKGSRAEGIYAYTAEYLNNMYRPSNGERIIEQVPSYDEWQAKLEENKRLKHDVGNLGYKIKNQRHEIDNRLKEIEKLKELLLQSRIYVKIETEDYDDRTVSKADKEEAKKLLTKIDEILK